MEADSGTTRSPRGMRFCDNSADPGWCSRDNIYQLKSGQFATYLRTCHSLQPSNHFFFEDRPEIELQRSSLLVFRLVTGGAISFLPLKPNHSAECRSNTKMQSV